MTGGKSCLSVCPTFCLSSPLAVCPLISPPLRPSVRQSEPCTPLSLQPLVFPPARLLCHQPSAPRPGTMATGELTELETAIEKIVSIFFTYAAREGRTGTLTAGEFKELVRLQLPNFMKVQGVQWGTGHGCWGAGRGLLA